MLQSVFFKVLPCVMVVALVLEVLLLLLLLLLVVVRLLPARDDCGEGAASAEVAQSSTILSC